MANDFPQRDLDDADEDEFWAVQRAAGTAPSPARAPIMIKVSVIQDNVVAYSEVYPIQKTGETEAAVTDAITKARINASLKPWGWTVRVDNA